MCLCWSRTTMSTQRGSRRSCECRWVRYWLCLLAMDKAVAGPLWQQEAHCSQFFLHLQVADACLLGTATPLPCSMHQSHLHSEMARLEREMAAKEHALLSMSQHAALKQK